MKIKRPELIELSDRELHNAAEALSIILMSAHINGYLMGFRAEPERCIELIKRATLTEIYDQIDKYKVLIPTDKG